MMLRTLTLMIAMALLAVSSRAHADEDASIAEDASALGDASTTDADAGSDSVGDDEVPVGLQPTVFDSNLGCAMAPPSQHHDSSSTSWIGLFLALTTISWVGARRRGNSKVDP